MKYTVTVLHNSGPGMFSRLREGDELSEAATFTLDATDPRTACEAVWTICNVDSASYLPPDLAGNANLVASYRARRNRSLSVADVVVLVDGTDQTTFWQVAAVGFDPIPVRAMMWTVDDPAAALSAAHQAMVAARDQARH